MRVRVTTESGSIYDLDNIALTWERKRGEGASFIRTDSGALLSFPDIRIGDPMILLGPPIPDWATARIIMTTAVVRYEAVMDENDVPDFQDWVDHSFLEGTTA